MLARTLSMVAMAAALSGSAMAGTILEIEPNNSLATAQNINGALPNAVIIGTVVSTYDFYAFSVVAPATWTFATFSNFDPELYLFDSAGNVLDGNDDAMGAEGSPNLYDPALQYTFFTPGTYYIGLCPFNCYGVTGGLAGGDFGSQTERHYEIHVDTLAAGQPCAVPEPLSLVLTGGGLLGLVLIRKRSKQRS